MTPDQIKAFQRGPKGGPRPVDFFGVPLLEDGDLGERTLWAMDFATQPRWRQDTVLFLLEYHGLRENGVNRHPLIDRAMNICRLDNDVDGPGPSEDGHPWCAAIACLALHLHSPYKFTPDALVRRLVKSLYPVDPELVQPADLGYTLRADGTGHIGTVVARGAGWTASIDGNVDNQMQTIRYPTVDRQYCSVQPPIRCPRAPLSIPIYGARSTR